MVLTDLLGHCRLALADSSVPSLWSDTELTEYANICIQRLVRETRISPYVEVYTVGISAGTAVYKFPKTVVEVVRADVASNTIPLDRMSITQLDFFSRKWKTEEASSARAYVLDTNAREIRLYPTPNKDDTLTMYIITMPDDMVFEGAGRSAEIPFDYKYQHMLVDGILSLCYLKDTPDTQNMQKAAFYETRFEKDIAQVLTEKRWSNDRAKSVNFNRAYL